MIVNPSAVSITLDDTASKFDTCANRSIALSANTPATLLQASGDRVYAAIVNTSSEDIYLLLGSADAQSYGKGILLKPNGSFEICRTNLYAGNVTAIAKKAAKVSTVECTKQLV